MSALLALAAAAASPLGVDEVRARYRSLEGDVVQVVGWMTECQPLSCAICPEADSKWRDCLSLGGNQRFDVAVYRARAVRGEVLIEARVTGNCFQDPNEKGDDIQVCTDRADMLQPIRLMKVIRYGRAPITKN